MVHSVVTAAGWCAGVPQTERKLTEKQFVAVKFWAALYARSPRTPDNPAPFNVVGGNFPEDDAEAHESVSQAVGATPASRGAPPPPPASECTIPVSTLERLPSVPAATMEPPAPLGVTLFVF